MGMGRKVENWALQHIQLSQEITAIEEGGLRRNTGYN